MLVPSALSSLAEQKVYILCCGEFDSLSADHARMAKLANVLVLETSGEILEGATPSSSTICPIGEIGRRGRLKISYSKGCPGSNPGSGTNFVCHGHADVAERLIAPDCKSGTFYGEHRWFESIRLHFLNGINYLGGAIPLSLTGVQWPSDKAGICKPPVVQ